MRSIISILVVAVIALGACYYFLKRASPAGTLPTQAVTSTGVEMDLNAIAQAERSYYAQNGSYASLDQLMSSNSLAMSRAERDGYTYTVETSPGAFTATARHAAAAPPADGGQSLRYPVISVDQSMQIHQGP
jgi:Tfp pilus assembly protein PilE